MQARRTFEDGGESLPGLIPARHLMQKLVIYVHVSGDGCLEMYYPRSVQFMLYGNVYGCKLNLYCKLDEELFNTCVRCFNMCLNWLWKSYLLYPESCIEEKL